MISFHRIGPLGQFCLVVAMSMCLYVLNFSHGISGPKITRSDPRLSLVYQNSVSLMITLKTLQSHDGLPDENAEEVHTCTITFNLMMFSLMKTLNRSITYNLMMVFLKRTLKRSLTCTITFNFMMVSLMRMLKRSITCTITCNLILVSLMRTLIG